MGNQNKGEGAIRRSSPPPLAVATVIMEEGPGFSSIAPFPGCKIGMFGSSMYILSQFQYMNYPGSNYLPFVQYVYQHYNTHINE